MTEPSPCCATLQHRVPRQRIRAPNAGALSPMPVSTRRMIVLTLVVGLVSPFASAQVRASATPNMADYIIAVVNQELVTNAELQQRMTRIREDAARSKTQLPPPAEFRKQVLDALIDERVQVTNARETGPKIDEAELDRAVLNVAVQNQMTLPQLRARLQQQGLAFSTFRNNVKDQLLMERVREREVSSRINVTDADIDALVAQRKAAASTSGQINIAQILVTVADGASALASDC